jgi:hypothetical protein
LQAMSADCGASAGASQRGKPRHRALARSTSRALPAPDPVLVLARCISATASLEGPTAQSASARRRSTSG